MKRTRVVNNSLQPQMLDSGVQLGAAGTPGSERTNVKLSSLDRERLVEPGTVAVIEPEESAQTQPKTPAPKRAPDHPADAVTANQ